MIETFRELLYLVGDRRRSDDVSTIGRPFVDKLSSQQILHSLGLYNLMVLQQTQVGIEQLRSWSDSKIKML